MPDRPAATGLLLLALLVAALPAAPEARAASCTVSTTADSAATPPANSLRAALANIACTTIDFALPGTGPWTIVVTGGALPVIGRDLTVTGPGANRLTIDGGSTYRVLTVFNGTVALAGLTVAHGHQTSAAIPGGGLHVRGGAVTLTGVVVRDTANTSGDGSTGGDLRPGSRESVPRRQHPRGQSGHRGRRPLCVQRRGHADQQHGQRQRGV